MECIGRSVRRRDAAPTSAPSDPHRRTRARPSRGLPRPRGPCRQRLASRASDDRNGRTAGAQGETRISAKELSWRIGSSVRSLLAMDESEQRPERGAANLLAAPFHGCGHLRPHTAHARPGHGCERRDGRAHASTMTIGASAARGSADARFPRAEAGARAPPALVPVVHCKSPPRVGVLSLLAPSDSAITGILSG